MGVEKGAVRSFCSSSGDVEWDFFLQPLRSEADLDKRFIKFLRSMVLRLLMTTKALKVHISSYQNSILKKNLEC